MAIDYQVHEDIVVMIFSGDVSKEEALRAREEAVLNQKQKGIISYLVDVREANVQMNTIELYDFFATFKEYFKVNTKHAVLYSMEASNLSDVSFGENISVNRGIMLKVFTSDGEAMAWLKHET